MRLKRMSLIAFAVGSAVLALAGASPARAQIIYDGTIVDRTGTYDGNPAHLFWNGWHYLWFGSGPAPDTIWMAKKQTNLGQGGWSTPVKVFGKGQTGWATNLVNNPAVVGGSFSFAGKTYPLAMYYTADRNCGGCDNAIGVAYSKDGIIWNSVTTAVVKPKVNGTTTFGAGDSGVARDPATGRIMHVYLDATDGGLHGWSILLNSSTDARTITPIPGDVTKLDLMGKNQDGQGADIAYNPVNGYWYATVMTSDGGNYPEVRILKASQPNVLNGDWIVLGFIDSVTTGKAFNSQPTLGKIFPDDSLYIDSGGWAYLFFVTGSALNVNKNDHAVAEARFHP